MIFVGEDWAGAHHDVHVMDETGTRLARKLLSNSLVGLRSQRFLPWLYRRCRPYVMGERPATPIRCAPSIDVCVGCSGLVSAERPSVRSVVQTQVDGPSEVECGGSDAEGEPVGVDTAVSDPAVPVGDDPSDAAFDHGTVPAVVLDAGAGLPLGAGSSEKLVVDTDGEGPATFGAGAAGPDRAAVAASCELGPGGVLVLVRSGIDVWRASLATAFAEEGLALADTEWVHKGTD